MKLENLTPQQESLLDVYKDKWLEIGLCTDPIDFEETKKAVNECYECAGLTPPTDIYKCDSPESAINLISELSNNTDKASILSDQIYGCHDAGWLSFYDFFLNESDVTGIDSVKGLIRLAKNCGWWAAYDTVAVVQERPKSIKFDDEKRLHCQDGPAITYRDGLEVYAWHGVRVDKEWIMNPSESLNPTIALNCENLEKRRVACEILGWDKILDQLNCKVIDQNEDPEIGALLEVEFPEIGLERFLKVQCGTKRTFALPVPFEMETALQANAWTYGLDISEYKPEVRT